MSCSCKPVLFIVVTLLAACSGTSGGPTSLTIKLNPQNNSGESGTAILTDAGSGKTKVDLTVSGQQAGVPNPVYIHQGTCDNLGQVVYPLTPVIDGKSSTNVDASLDSLKSGGYAINGHKSPADLKIYIFCGDIK